MDPKGRALGSLLFHLLIVLGASVCIASETSAWQLHGDHAGAVKLQEKQETYHHSHSSSHHHMMSHMDTRASVFFFIEDLHLGNKMTTNLDDEHPNPLSSPYLLPTKREADAIPFSMKQLRDILRYFSFPQGSLKAQVIEDTIRGCESMPMKGERKFCATSYESLVNFAREILGFEADIQVLYTKIFEHSKGPTNVRKLMDYTIVQITQDIAAPRTVSCHPTPYPYEVIYCHSLEGGTLLRRVSLQDENGGKIEAIAICHLDTSQWSPDHLSFQALGIKPGTAPVCHFLPISSFTLIPSKTNSI